MQPYFLPYIGYWQLINYVDKFVIYDNIQYTKKGWINRNKILQNGKASTFTIPLKKDSDYLNIIDRRISPEFNKQSFLSKIKFSYSKSSRSKEILVLMEKIIQNNSSNLFTFIYCSIIQICKFLDIDSSKLIISSEIPVNHNLKSQKKIISICKELKCLEYINPIGGETLYSKSEFKKEGVKLNFLKSNQIVYKQFNNEFLPSLSILDVLMFNDIKKVKEIINNEFLIK